jgi:uncharacterized repeat protein (TIGR03803 family)
MMTMHSFLISCTRHLHNNFSARDIRHTLAALAVATVLTGQGHASPSLTALTNFNGPDGWLPVSSLIADADGNLFGTTALNGTSQSSYGTVFEIPKQCRLRLFRSGVCIISGYATTPTVLVTFNGTNGAQPNGPLLADASGNLFGTTENGGTNGLGTVFEVIKPAGGWTAGLSPTVLVNFNGTDGDGPSSGLIADAAGNLFGTTGYGGATNNYGTVYEIPRECRLRLFPSGACVAYAYASTPTTLVGFNGTNGIFPGGNLLADTNGNLFGTTGGGGPDFSFENPGNGTVFEVVKPSGGWTAYLTPVILVAFNATNGSAPYGSLIADAGGNLFGVTTTGANGYTKPGTGDGTVFEVVKCLRFVIRGVCPTGYSPVPLTFVNFDATDGSVPGGGLIADANGNLFGTTIWGGANSQGTAYEIVKPAGGWAANLTPAILANFDIPSGYNPHGGLIPDGSGNLFGTASYGGAYADGTVFEISGSGYQP